MNTICEEHGKKFTYEIKVKQMGQKEHAAGKILIGKLNFYEDAKKEKKYFFLCMYVFVYSLLFEYFLVL